jgi:hypothetical protein
MKLTGLGKYHCRITRYVLRMRIENARFRRIDIALYNGPRQQTDGSVASK